MSDRKDKTYSKENIFDFSKKNGATPIEGFDAVWIKVADVQSKEQPWFWPGMIPNETITLFAGVGGIGKSLLLLYIVSKTSTGEAFRACGFDFALPKGQVILLSAEDECDTHVKPKLLAMGADTDKVYYVKSKVGQLSGAKRFLELDKDLRAIEAKINLLGDVRLIVIDPIAYFIGEVRDHVNVEVANFLGTLNELAKKHKIAILFSKHLRKHAAGSKGVISASSEVGGAGAWTNTPRKCWLVTSHHEDINIKIISQMKDNLSQSTDENLAFKIYPKTIADNGLNIKTTELLWLDKTVTMTADEAINKNTFEMSKLEQAIKTINDHLIENGQSVVKHIEQVALKKGISLATFRRATAQFEKNLGKNLKIDKGTHGGKVYMLIE